MLVSESLSSGPCELCLHMHGLTRGDAHYVTCWLTADTQNMCSGVALMHSCQHLACLVRTAVLQGGDSYADWLAAWPALHWP